MLAPPVSDAEQIRLWKAKGAVEAVTGNEAASSQRTTTRIPARWNDDDVEKGRQSKAPFFFFPSRKKLLDHPLLLEVLHRARMEWHSVAFQHLFLGDVGHRGMELLEVFEAIEHRLSDDGSGSLSMACRRWRQDEWRGGRRRLIGLRGVGAFVTSCRGSLSLGRREPGCRSPSLLDTGARYDRSADVGLARGGRLTVDRIRVTRRRSANASILLAAQRGRHFDEFQSTGRISSPLLLDAPSRPSPVSVVPRAGELPGRRDVDAKLAP